MPRNLGAIAGAQSGPEGRGTLVVHSGGSVLPRHAGAVVSLSPGGGSVSHGNRIFTAFAMGLQKVIAVGVSHAFHPGLLLDMVVSLASSRDGKSPAHSVSGVAPAQSRDGVFIAGVD